MNPRCVGELSVSASAQEVLESPYRTLPNGTVMEYAGFSGADRSTYSATLTRSAHQTYQGGGGGGGHAQEYAGFSAAEQQTYSAPNDSNGHATYRGEEIYGRQADREDIYAGADAVRIPDPPPGVDQDAAWYHGFCSRGTAERSLYLQGDAAENDGMFLIRQSPNGKNEVIFCVLYGGQVQHFKARYQDKGYWFYGKTFDNVQSIIDFHKRNRIGTGPVLLRQPCARF